MKQQETYFGGKVGRDLVISRTDAGEMAEWEWRQLFERAMSKPNYPLAYALDQERLTPEERAVIEAADVVERECIAGDSWGHVHPAVKAFALSVRALRESRQPKPRWHLTSGNTISDGRTVLHATGPCGCLDEVMLILNAAEPK